MVAVPQCELCGDLFCVTFLRPRISHQRRGPTLNSYLGFLLSSLKTTFSPLLPPGFAPPCMPTFVSPETEKDSKCKLSPLGWEQPTDSSLPLWRTQGCLCKCQSHAVHTAVLHMLRSACPASTAWWKTCKKINQVCSKMTKQSKQPPFCCHKSPYHHINSHPILLCLIFAVIVLVIVFVLWPSQIDLQKVFDNSTEKKITFQGPFERKGKNKTKHSCNEVLRLSWCSLCQSNLGLGLRLGTHQLWSHGGRERH